MDQMAAAAACGLLRLSSSSEFEENDFLKEFQLDTGIGDCSSALMMLSSASSSAPVSAGDAAGSDSSAVHVDDIGRLVETASLVIKSEQQQQMNVHELTEATSGTQEQENPVYSFQGTRTLLSGPESCPSNVLEAEAFCDAILADECWESLLASGGLGGAVPCPDMVCCCCCPFAPPLPVPTGTCCERKAALFEWILQQQQEQKQWEELQRSLQVQQLYSILAAAKLELELKGTSHSGQCSSVGQFCLLQVDPSHTVPACSNSEQRAQLGCGSNLEDSTRQKTTSLKIEALSRREQFLQALETARKKNLVIELVDDDDDDEIAVNIEDDEATEEEALPGLSEVQSPPNYSAAELPHTGCNSKMKLTDAELVTALQLKRKASVARKTENPFGIEEADVYALDPNHLLPEGNATRYFFSLTRYCSFTKPTRSRISTVEGARWKQQGPSLRIKLDGEVLAYKTYLSFVRLRKPRRAGGNLHEVHPKSRTLVKPRRYSLYTMEEIVLKEDKDNESRMMNEGLWPLSYTVLCRISRKSYFTSGD